MKIKLGGLAAIAGAMLLSMALPVHGQSPAPATVDFTNIANPDIFGDGYVDPYVGSVTINGSTINNNGLIVCDDFDDNIYLPELWNATALTAPQLTTLTSAQLGADTLFGSTIGLDGYAAVASLVTQLLNLSPPNSLTTSPNQLKRRTFRLRSGISRLAEPRVAARTHSRAILSMPTPRATLPLLWQHMEHLGTYHMEPLHTLALTIARPPLQS